jgi:YVTN family beta-propeller protein
MKTATQRALAAVLLLFVVSPVSFPQSKVGGPDFLMPTWQLLSPAGEAVTFPGRPVDLRLGTGGRHVYVKDNRGIVVIERAGWRVVQELAFPKSGASLFGTALSQDGNRLYATTAGEQLFEAEIQDDGKLKWGRTIALPGPDKKKASHSLGLALSADGSTLYVCMSRNNALGVVDLKEGKLVKQIPVGVAPYAVVLAADGKHAFVSNWGGRHPAKGDKQAPSSGTPVAVDDRGIANDGTVGRVNLADGKMVSELTVGLHPNDMVLHPGSKRLFVANANSDTVSVVDSEAFRVSETINVRPSADLPFGSMPNALALSADGRKLYVANGGNNAVAVVHLDQGKAGSRVAGFIPTAWFPGALALDGNDLFVANVKGYGSRNEGKQQKGWSARNFLGVVSRVPLPDEKKLETWTAQVKKGDRHPEILKAHERSDTKVKPVPVPRKLGEPSVFEHVVYIIKENRTYDQMLGDLPKGNGDPKLCLYPRKITPNLHALAEQFVLLDNFYCNGVISSDGHAWATQGIAVPYLERSFGGWTRSYPSEDIDPLAIASSGLLWDSVILAGLSFRNYGEAVMSYPVPPKASFKEIFDDYEAKAGKIAFKHTVLIDPVKRFTCPDYPGWNMKIPDKIRADIFLRELAEFEKKGTFPNLTIVYLPQDHTSGRSKGMPTPNAHQADNDLALGRVVEGLSASKFWPKTCIFVVEDDPQDGIDHVDGHRSVGLVISPYTKRKAVVSKFYNQTGVIHTMQRILGLPPLTQQVALSPLMTECFADAADLTPFKALPASVPLDQLNPAPEKLKGKERVWAERSELLDLTGPDRADDDLMNRILWHAARGVDKAFPVEWAGAHGRGLKALGLRLEKGK